MARLNAGLVAKTPTIQYYGGKIRDDAIKASSTVKNDWSTFENEYEGKGQQANQLPSCLQADFSGYDIAHKKELETILDNQKQIGQTLHDAADLIDFQDKLIGKSFNIYGGNYYNSSQDNQIVNHLYPGFDQ